MGAGMSSSNESDGVGQRVVPSRRSVVVARLRKASATRSDSGLAKSKP